MYDLFNTKKRFQFDIDTRYARLIAFLLWNSIGNENSLLRNLAEHDQLADVQCADYISSFVYSYIRFKYPLVNEQNFGISALFVVLVCVRRAPRFVFGQQKTSQHLVSTINHYDASDDMDAFHSVMIFRCAP